MYKRGCIFLLKLVYGLPEGAALLESLAVTTSKEYGIRNLEDDNKSYTYFTSYYGNFRSALRF